MLEPKFGTLKPYSSSITDNKFIGGHSIAYFMLYITQCVEYIHTKTLLSIFIDENNLKYFHRKLGFNKIKDSITEDRFKHEKQPLKDDINFDDNQIFYYNWDSNIPRYFIELNIWNN